jgi:hypothetical protein
VEGDNSQITSAVRQAPDTLIWEFDIQPSSPCKGVYFDKARGKWKAQATWKGKKYPLGRFSDQGDAEKAYLEFRAEHPAYR